MRLPGHTDAVAVAAIMRSAQVEERAEILRRSFARATIASAHVRATGQLHGSWGDGSLMAASRSIGIGFEPSLDDYEFCRCLADVYDAIADYPLAQATHFVAQGST